MTISTIIVTYNRKNELLRCLDAVLNQSLIPNNIIIVNNASTDGTEDELYKIFRKHDNPESTFTEGCLVYRIEQQIPNNKNTSLYLINMEQNEGGAGGFYTGLKFAHTALNTDFYWMMDDDGYPEQHCLEQLLTFKDNYDYIMPTSIDANDNTKLSWPTRKKNGKKTVYYDELKNSWGQIMNYVTPFNGVLLSKKCVTEAGYINKDFFIWGDDYEHYYRCTKNGFTPVTLMDSIFYHPSQKVQMVKIFFGLISIAYSDSKVRMICLARNWTYIYRHYNKSYMIPIKFLMYFWLFIFTRHGDFEGWKLYKQSVNDGIREEFTRHLQYSK